MTSSSLKAGREKKLLLTCFCSSLRRASILERASLRASFTLLGIFIWGFSTGGSTISWKKLENSTRYEHSKDLNERVWGVNTYGSVDHWQMADHFCKPQNSEWTPRLTLQQPRIHKYNRWRIMRNSMGWATYWVLEDRRQEMHHRKESPRVRQRPFRRPTAQSCTHRQLLQTAVQSKSY